MSVSPTPGLCSDKGHGVPQDLERGKHWLTRAAYRFNQAAESGYKPAMPGLTDVYEKGLLGVKPDPKLAARWRGRAK